MGGATRLFGSTEQTSSRSFPWRVLYWPENPTDVLHRLNLPAMFRPGVLGPGGHAPLLARVEHVG